MARSRHTAGRGVRPAGPISRSNREYLMKTKLRLDIDALTVESFETRADAPRLAGTVHGHAEDYSANETECADLCATQAATCATCDAYCEEELGPLNRRIILY